MPTAFARKFRAVTAAGAAVGAALTIGAGVAAAHDWTGVAQCESGGNWHIDTGNDYYGGLQFHIATWREYGGVGNPAHASRAEQVRVAERVLIGQGVGAWPTCGRYLRDGVSPALAVEGLLPPGSLGASGSSGSAGSSSFVDAAAGVNQALTGVNRAIADVTAAVNAPPMSVANQGSISD